MLNLMILSDDLDVMEKLLVSAMRILPTDPDYSAKIRIITTLMTQVAVHKAMAKPAVVTR